MLNLRKLPECNVSLKCGVCSGENGIVECCGEEGGHTKGHRRKGGVYTESEMHLKSYGKPPLVSFRS